MSARHSDALIFFGAPTSGCSATRWKATPLFAREDAAVEAAWSIVQPILGTTSIHEYEPGTWGPAEADRLTADVGGWHCPEGAS